ncbi:hypothetical protein HAX54_041757, partial [Datura stramonium]|nr:hypothetical protein [Datura stramonium]
MMVAWRSSSNKSNNEDVDETAQMEFEESDSNVEEENESQNSENTKTSLGKENLSLKEQ